METMLSLRTLNRALLQRQLLIERSAMTAQEAVAHLIGLQAQAVNPPYVGLWTRLARFTVDDLGGLLLDRKLVRMALMRSTIHLVTGDDCLGLRPLVAPCGSYLTIAICQVRWDRQSKQEPPLLVGGSAGHAVKSPLIGTSWGDFLPWRAAYWLAE